MRLEYMEPENIKKFKELSGAERAEFITQQLAKIPKIIDRVDENEPLHAWRMKQSKEYLVWQLENQYKCNMMDSKLLIINVLNAILDGPFVQLMDDYTISADNINSTYPQELEAEHRLRDGFAKAIEGIEEALDIEPPSHLKGQLHYIDKQWLYEKEPVDHKEDHRALFYPVRFKEGGEQER